MDIKDRIILESLQLFIRKGVRSVNMDDVSSELGISKKTLYLYVNNKSQLVNFAFEFYILQIQNALLDFLETNNNAIDELNQIDEKIFGLVKTIHFPLISELKKYYRDTWNLVDDFKKTFLFKVISENIQKGIKQGLFLENTNVDFIAKIFISRSESLIDFQFFSDKQSDFKNLLKEHRVYHIRGIATLKGIKYLEEKIKKW